MLKRLALLGLLIAAPLSAMLYDEDEDSLSVIMALCTLEDRYYPQQPSRKVSCTPLPYAQQPTPKKVGTTSSGTDIYITHDSSKKDRCSCLSILGLLLENLAHTNPSYFMYAHNRNTLDGNHS